MRKLIHNVLLESSGRPRVGDYLYAIKDVYVDGEDEPSIIKDRFYEIEGLSSHGMLVTNSKKEDHHFPYNTKWNREHFIYIDKKDKGDVDSFDPFKSLYESKETNTNFDLKGKSWHIDLANNQEAVEAQNWLFRMGFTWPSNNREIKHDISSLQSVYDHNINRQEFTKVGSIHRGDYDYENIKEISLREGVGTPIHIIWSDVREILVDFDPFENLYESEGSNNLLPDGTVITFDANTTADDVALVNEYLKNLGYGGFGESSLQDIIDTLEDEKFTYIRIWNEILKFREKSCHWGSVEMFNANHLENKNILKYSDFLSIMNKDFLGNINESEDDFEWAKDLLSQDPFMGKYVKLYGKSYNIGRNGSTWSKVTNQEFISKIVGEKYVYGINCYQINLPSGTPIYIPKREITVNDVVDNLNESDDLEWARDIVSSKLDLRRKLILFDRKIFDENDIKKIIHNVCQMMVNPEEEKLYSPRVLENIFREGLGHLYITNDNELLWGNILEEEKIKRSVTDDIVWDVVLDGKMFLDMNLNESEDNLEWAKDLLSQDPFMGKYVKLHGKKYNLPAYTVPKWPTVSNQSIVGRIVLEEIRFTKNCYIVEIERSGNANEGHTHIYIPKDEFTINDIVDSPLKESDDLEWAQDLFKQSTDLSKIDVDNLEVGMKIVVGGGKNRGLNGKTGTVIDSGEQYDHGQRKTTKFKLIAFDNWYGGYDDSTPRRDSWSKPNPLCKKRNCWYFTKHNMDKGISFFTNKFLNENEDPLEWAQDVVSNVNDFKVSYTDDMSRIGQKVVRGRDWRWGNQDGNSVGEIIDTPYKNENEGDDLGGYWVRVRWSDGDNNIYRVGPDFFDLHYDIKLNENEEADEFEWARDILKQPVQALAVGGYYKVKPEATIETANPNGYNLHTKVYEIKDGYVSYYVDNDSIDEKTHEKYRGNRKSFLSVNHARSLVKDGYWIPITEEESMIKK